MMTKGCEALRLSPDWSDPPLQPAPAVGKLCDPGENACLGFWKAQGAQLRALATGERVLLQRYRALRGQRYYATTLTPGICTPIPRVSGLMRIQRLDATLAASRALAGERAAGLAELQADLAFGRRLLAGADTLLLKMVAAAMVQRDILTLSELMDANGVGPDTVPAIAPLSLDERSMRRAAGSEFRSLAQMVRGLKKEGALGAGRQTVTKRLLDPLLKPRRSLNRAQAAYAGWAAASEAPANRWSEAEVHFERPLGWSDYLRNPLGTLYWAMARPAIGGYLERLGDLDGLITLYNAKRAILAARIEPDRVQAFLRRQQDRFHSPYSAAVLHWDASQQRISFSAPARKGTSHSLQLHLRGAR